jgi:NAD(P)-dependent dehydrogenase (short-subunit alcohol dehydrogenase family)
MFKTRYQGCKSFMPTVIVTNATEVQSIMAAIVAQFWSIELLWNDAGFQGHITPTLDYNPTDFALVMSINVTGSFVLRGL